MSHFNYSNMFIFFEKILLFVRMNRKDIFLFVFLSAICLSPNLFYIFFGSSLSGNYTKQIIFFSISIIFFLIPFLIFKVRSSFLINGIFVLIAPLEIADIYLNKETVSPGFMLLILQTDFNESSELLGSIKLLIFAYLLVYLVYFFGVSQLSKDLDLFTKKRRLVVTSLCLLLLSSLYLYFFALNSKIVPDKKEVFMFANGSFLQKFEEIYPYDILYSINEGIKQHQTIKKTSADVEHFSFGAKQIVRTNEKEIYVLVIGETARYANFSINNYTRITSPLLSKITNLVSFSDVYSEANETRTSLPILLTRATAENFKLFTKEKSIIDAFDEAGFSTYWIANQSVGDTFIQRVVKKTRQCFFVAKKNNSSDNFDEKLWVYLDKILAKKEKKQFIVIHTMGSHYRYDNRYPLAFNKFQPSLEGTFSYGVIDVQNKDKLINSYDNSILYTDYFLSNTIAKISKKKGVSSLVYISDHGENLFEKGRVLHGGISPTISEVHVPFFVWTSEKFNQLFPQKKTSIIENANKSITSSVVFYSLLDLANIDIRENKKQKSICSPLLQNDSLRFALNINEQLIKMNK